METVTPRIRLGSHRSDSRVAVRISATSDKQPDEIEMPALSGNAQRRIRHRVRFVNIWIGTCVKELLRNIIMAEPAGVGQGGPLTGVTGVERCAVKKKLKDLRTVSGACREHQRCAIVDRVWLDGGHKV